MNTIKNIDIAREYNVSSSTVTRWVQLHAEGKNNLQLHEKNNKFWIVDNAHNRAEIARLVEEGKKYRSNIDCKRYEVPIKFYETFSEEEQIEIVNDLEYNKDVNLKFSYKDNGAKSWDKFYLTNTSPITSNVENLLKTSIDDIRYLLTKNNKVNVIDIGTGNGYPMKSFISNLKNRFEVENFIAIDISKNMADISLLNVTKWYPDIKSKVYVQDLESGRFSKIFYENKSSSDHISNIVLHIGNTICNIDDKIEVYKNLRKALTIDDILMFTFTLDNPDTRSTLNYQKSPEQFNLQHWIPNLLGIDSDQCEIKLEFDDSKKLKKRSIILDKDYILNFNLFGQTRSIELYSGQGICTWKHYVLTIEEIISELKSVGLDPVNIKVDISGSTALVICKIF
jgi:SAM-dependent methyltransferase